LILVFLEQKAGKDGRSWTTEPQKEAARAWSKNKLEANILRRRAGGEALNSDHLEKREELE